jgi:hypothetical protein
MGPNIPLLHLVPQPPMCSIHILTLLQTLSDVLGLISNAHRVMKIELLVWNLGQGELFMFTIHHQLCWAPGLLNLREIKSGSKQGASGSLL